MFAIKFEILNEYNNILGKVFENINFENVFWRVINQEVFDEKGKEFFTKEIYSDSEFKNLINSKKYYPIFLTLQLYKKEGKIAEIKNYDDYFNSDCDLILYIIDNIFVEIYSKNKLYINKIRENALKNNFSKVENIKQKSEFSLYY